MKARRIFSFFADAALIFLFIYLLVFPQNASVPTREALGFCGKTLVPSLFIYIVIAQIVITLPITDKLTKRFGYEAVTLITGILCGCPVGAKTAFSLYKTGRISKKHAEYLCSFSNNASISFVIGYVGSELFGDIKIGLKLIIFQISASLITAIAMKFAIFGREKLPKPKLCSSVRFGLREAITDSAVTMLNLCACVIFFIVCGGAVSEILKLTPTADAILKSVLEFSSGCAAAANTGRYALAVTAFSIGFTGLSVALQVKSIVSGQLSLKPFAVGKLISCAVMTALAIIFG